MADQNCNSSSSTPVIITTPSDIGKSVMEEQSSVKRSCDRIYAEKTKSIDDESVVTRQPPIVVFNDSTPSGNSNGVADGHEKVIKPSLFLRPSALSGDGFSSTSSIKCPLKSPKLNLQPSKFGSGDGSLNSPFSSPKTPGANVFTNSVGFDEDKQDGNHPTNNKSSVSKNPECEPKFVGPLTNLNSTAASISPSSSLSVSNFVFGQNLHERVSDSIKPTNDNDIKSEASTSNGTSDMLFTSVLTNKEIGKEPAVVAEGNGKESSSLLEDAARYQEARANKRKYEEVLVTTGEEGEENILQVNVKLFAFDNGTWVERGRGTLRLNDKAEGESPAGSRIVIRTLGSLRVVLNTSIWSGMSLEKASERSVRITALDPNGHVKVFLVQSSPKDMASLYRCLETRVKKCQEKEKEQEKGDSERPQKKVAGGTVDLS